MANSTVNSSSVVTEFENETFKEYLRGDEIYSPFIGSEVSAPIQIKNGLKTVSIPLVSKLAGNGVSGSGTLAGNEEVLSNYAFTLTPTHYRNGVLVDNEENEKSAFEMKKEGKAMLMPWAMEKKRDHITQAMCAIQAGGTYYNYGDASASNLDTWNTNNQDRILYGAAKSNLSAGNHTASLANIDTTNDKLTAARITLLKRMATSATPLIRPFKIDGLKPWFVFFVDPFGFRDLKEDSTIAQANREARPRDVNTNPIFTDGDLLYDGVIIKQVYDLPKFVDGDGSGNEFDGVLGANATSGDGLDNGGASSNRIGIGFFCGAQALGFGLGKKPGFKVRKEDDYEFQNGVAIEMKHDIKKLFYNNKQHGMITHFYSAAVDS